MDISPQHPLHDYLREGMMPHIWCSGCGNGIVLNCFLRALKSSQIDMDSLVVISGVGCAGRFSGYIKADSFHTTHGRTIPLATGVKLANPRLKVAVVSGDGDLFAIGGNHFVQAARRNVDMLVICSNNFNYGMTGGQFGPTTPLEAVTATTPYGNVEPPFNLVHLAAASGAVYVARWTTYHVTRLDKSIRKGLGKKGFSFIEVLSPCPEIYGRYSSLGSGIEIMRWFRRASRIADGLNPSEADIAADRIDVGEFLDVDKPSYNDLLNRLRERITR